MRNLARDVRRDSVSFKTKALKHWKSTLSGLLTLCLTTTGAVMAIPDVRSVMSAKLWISLLIVQGVGKTWVSLIQEDAGVVEAKVAGEPGTQMVPAHEIPNDPAAVPVIKEQ
jgi:hypothetical protein